MNRLRRPVRRSFLRSVATWLSLAAASALVPAAALAQANGKLQLHHINVGQGDGILVISPLGQKALFDDGNYLGCSGIKTYLQGLGISVVDYHFTSHYHSDHIGCIDDLAAIGITIGTAGYDRGSSYSSGVFTAYVNTLGAKRQTIAKNQIITLDAGSANPVFLKCVELNGAGVYSPSGSDENAKSLVMKVSYGAFDEVIAGDLTGDGATDVETTVGPQVGDVEVYKVHHHGSRFSSNANWLAAIDAEVGIIQVGDGNSYGHPTLDALTRLHAAGVKTYWTQTGAGAAPSPGWDTVANGTIVVQADPGSSATYTVSGPGFSHAYTNGGGAPPINTTEVAEGVTLTKGSITVGDFTRLAADDASRMSISAGVTGGQFLTDWYGSATLDHPPLNLTVRYDGNYTVSRTQTLYLWNWNTSAWVQVDQATVSTADALRSYTTASPAAYVSPTREVRLRVATNTRASSFTCRGDWMAFTYDYASGTAPQGVQTASAFASRHDHDAGEVSAHSGDDVSRSLELPLRALRRVSAEPGEAGVTLAWAVGVHEHVDGFNVYRELADGSRAFVGEEPTFESDGEEASFAYVDRAPGTGVYWLGVRGCSGPEALIGPVRASSTGRGDGARLTFAIAPNPVRAEAGFAFGLSGAGLARIDVFDVHGRRVASPFDGWLPAGEHRMTWDLRTRGGERLGDGIYFARMQAGGRTRLQRMIVVGN